MSSMFSERRVDGWECDVNGWAGGTGREGVPQQRNKFQREEQ